VSLTEISTRLGIIAGLAMLALLVIGWRKPARNFPLPPRAEQQSRQPDQRQPDQRLLDESNPLNTAAPDLSETIARKVLDATGLGAIALVGGIVAAIVIATALSFIVTNVISRL
jgi:hypothetical protein